MRRYPEPTVGALIFNRKGELFLVKSHKWKGKYVVPGGHIKLGESAEAALKREVKEETGLDVSNIQFLCFQEFRYGKEFWKKRHFIFLDFACTTNSTKVRLDDEAESYVWGKPRDLKKLPVEPYTRKAIKIFLKRKKL